MEKMLKKGSKDTKHSHLKHPINNPNNPPIQRTDKGRNYSCIFITDKGYRFKCMASKHPHPKYYITMYMQMAHTVSTPYTAFLQLLLSKRLNVCKCKYK